jgi:hypothetical protein
MYDRPFSLTTEQEDAMKKRTRKLLLARETVRDLSGPEAEWIAGGIFSTGESRCAKVCPNTELDCPPPGTR